MGKSTAARFFAERGLPVIDTDELARELVEPGQPALGEIRAAFGETVMDARGKLRRDELAKVVFADPAKRERLEGILHPRIRAAWLGQVENLKNAGRPAVVVVIPLLFETDAAKHFTHVVCVACSSATQRARLRERGWSEQQIERRIASQWPIAKKISAAQFVIWSEGELGAHAAQVDQILERLQLSRTTA